MHALLGLNCNVEIILLSDPPHRYHYLSEDVSDPRGPKTYQVLQVTMKACIYVMDVQVINFIIRMSICLL